MSERTIRTFAKNLAGAFYDSKRSDVFRSKDSKTAAKKLFKDPKTGAIVEKTVIVPFFEAYPTADTYIKGHWPFFYDQARKCLTTMLGLPHVHKNVKDAILKALVEDREDQIKAQASGKRLVDNPLGQM